jgi:Reverse transcriptase (RNA-dependent DNA polymerase)
LGQQLAAALLVFAGVALGCGLDRVARRSVPRQKPKALSIWMARNYPDCLFERYADDGVVHCKSRRQDDYVLAAIAARMNEVGLRLRPEKTRIVYCKDSNRRGKHEQTSFTFLGYTFRPRDARRKDGAMFTSVLPAISPEALKARSAPAPRAADGSPRPERLVRRAR